MERKQDLFRCMAGIIGLLLCTTPLLAQNPQWAFREFQPDVPDPMQHRAITEVAVNSQGHVIGITEMGISSQSSPMEFLGQTFEPNPVGEMSRLLVCFDSTGTVLWHRVFSSDFGAQCKYYLSLDDEDRIHLFIEGNFGTTLFFPDTTVSGFEPNNRGRMLRLAPDGAFDQFLFQPMTPNGSPWRWIEAKGNFVGFMYGGNPGYNGMQMRGPDGTLLWEFTYPTFSFYEEPRFTVLADSSVVVAGVWGSAPLVGQTMEGPVANETYYAYRVSRSGELLWYKSFASDQNDAYNGVLRRIWGVEELPGIGFVMMAEQGSEVTFAGTVFSGGLNESRKILFMVVDYDGNEVVGHQIIGNTNVLGSNEFPSLSVGPTGRIFFASQTFANAIINGYDFTVGPNAVHPTLYGCVDPLEGLQYLDIADSPVLAQGGSNRQEIVVAAGTGFFLFARQNVNVPSRVPCLEPVNGPFVVAWIRDEPKPAPQVAFEIAQDLNTVFTRNLSVDAESQLWSFGNGSTATTFNGLVTYAQPGAYNVCLSATNFCGTVQSCQLVQVDGLSAVRPNTHANVGVCVVTVLGGGLTESSDVRLTGGGPDIVGTNKQLLQAGALSVAFPMNGVATGVYDLQATISGTTYTLPNAFTVTGTGPLTMRLQYNSPTSSRFNLYVPDRYTLINESPAPAMGLFLLDDNLITTDAFTGYIAPNTNGNAPFLQAAESFISDNGLPTNQFSFPSRDPGLPHKVTGFFFANVPGRGETLLNRTMNQPFSALHTKQMVALKPLVEPASEAGAAINANDICLGEFLRVAVDATFGLDTDAASFATCFAPIQQAFLNDVITLAYGPFADRPLPVARVVLGLFKQLADAGCVAGLPASYTVEQAHALSGHVMHNMLRLDAAGQMNCEGLDQLFLPVNGTEAQADVADRGDDFCTILGEIVAGGTNIGIATQAKRLCHVGSSDPNAKVGPGYSPTQTAVNYRTNIGYTILFENIENATLPAAVVIITDTLDLTRIDVSNFRFGPMFLGEERVFIPNQVGNRFMLVADLQPELPLLLLITGELDPATGIITWRFESLDPTTLAPPDDSTLGFLPPNLDGIEGTGSVSFTVDWVESITSGTLVDNRAEIIFDNNEPIITDIWRNLYDDVAPESAVLPLPANTPSTTFMVSWDGTDDAAGIAAYYVFVSEDGGPFLLWLTTSETTAPFTGENGSTYRFYTRARDWATNLEDAPQAEFDAITTITSTGIADNAGNRGLSCFPNPARDVLTIVLEGAQVPATYRIMDALGGIVQEGRALATGRFDLSVRELAAGLYSLQVQGEGRIATVRFVKE